MAMAYLLTNVELEATKKFKNDLLAKVLAHKIVVDQAGDRARGENAKRKFLKKQRDEVKEMHDS
jgi:hypothetical protein